MISRSPVTMTPAYGCARGQACMWMIRLLACWCLCFCATVQASPLPMLNGLPELKDYTAQRSSSSDPNWKTGNGDARWIPAGETLTLADLKGPGRITHIWFTIASNERYYGRKMVLRMYWDGETSPSVEAPVNDFFCQGHGLDVDVHSLPFRVTADGRARNCYFVMPFRKSARLTITNEGAEPCQAFFWYIDWQQLKKKPARTPYFHAQYRQQFPCKPGEDYTILDARGDGHFVGCQLSVAQRTDGWWGEGDDFFYIDGERVPSLKGTGSEDYFCDAWGIRKQDGLFYGAPLVEGMSAGDSTTAYRFHIPDPVPFKTSLRMTIEHKGAAQRADGSWDGFAERADDFSSVAYWYQLEPHAPFPKLPSVSERLQRIAALHVVEAEGLAEAFRAEGKPIIVQESPAWSGSAQILFTPERLPASLTVPFTISKLGKYRVFVHATRSFDYGIYRVRLDGVMIKPAVDLFATTVLPQVINLGVRQLSAGSHTVSLECLGSGSESSGYYLGLDCLLIEAIR